MALTSGRACASGSNTPMPVESALLLQSERGQFHLIFPQAMKGFMGFLCSAAADLF